MWRQIKRESVRKRINIVIDRRSRTDTVGKDSEEYKSIHSEKKERERDREKEEERGRDIGRIYT